MLGWMRVLGACGVVAIMVFFLGSAFSAGDVSRLSLAESSDLWGLGGACTGTKTVPDDWGCASPPCTSILNIRASGTGNAKITPWNCYYTYPSGYKVTCGPNTVATKCAK